MDMKKEADKIYSQNITKTLKIKMLNDLLLDCYNEMEAQDQNMHPEVQHRASEGYRVIKDYLRILESSNEL